MPGKLGFKILVILNPASYMHVDILRFCLHSFEVYSVTGLDLQRLGSQAVIMPKNLPDHCSEVEAGKSSHASYFLVTYFKINQ